LTHTSFPYAFELARGGKLQITVLNVRRNCGVKRRAARHGGELFSPNGSQDILETLIQAIKGLLAGQ
jgi:hypothetical protein